MTRNTIPFHPLANIFPLVESAIAEIAGDIAENGFRAGEEIVLLDGKILDGRTRYSALQKLVVEKTLPATALDPSASSIFTLFAENNHFGAATIKAGPLKYVVSKNLKRRHLTDDQRRMAAARIAELSRGRPKKNAANGGISRAIAAELLKVDPAGLERARTIVTKGAAELQAAVDAGKATVRAAADIAKLPKAEQIKLLKEAAADPDVRRAIKRIAKETRREEQVVRHGVRQDLAAKISAKNPRPEETGRTWPIVVVDIPRENRAFDKVTGSEKAPDNHYPTLTFEEQLAFPIDRFAAPEAIIVFASTAASLIDDIDVLAEWGFVALRPRGTDGKLLRDEGGALLPLPGKGRYGSHLVWHKQRIGKRRGMGRWVEDQHELWIIARRGTVMPAPIPGTQPPSCFDAPVGAHSAKPNGWLRDAIDRCWPDSEKVEIFARKEPPRKGWMFWGNQAGEGEDDGSGGQQVGRSGEEQHDAASVSRSQRRRKGRHAGGEGQGARTARADRKPRTKPGAVARKNEVRGSRHVGREAHHALSAEWRRVFGRLRTDLGKPVPKAELKRAYADGREPPKALRENWSKMQPVLARAVAADGYRLASDRKTVTLFREAAK